MANASPQCNIWRPPSHRMHQMHNATPQCNSAAQHQCIYSCLTACPGRRGGSPACAARGPAPKTLGTASPAHLQDGLRRNEVMTTTVGTVQKAESTWDSISSAHLREKAGVMQASCTAEGMQKEAPVCKCCAAGPRSYAPDQQNKTTCRATVKASQWMLWNSGGLSAPQYTAQQTVSIEKASQWMLWNSGVSILL